MALWYIAAFCAYFVKGLCGFANTLVLTAILSFGVDNIEISPVELLLGIPMNAVMAWRGRRRLQASIVAPLICYVLSGNIVGTVMLKNINAAPIRALCGFVVMAVALEMLARTLRPRRAKQSKAVLAIIGVASGVCCGLFGIGALLAAYIGRITDDSETLKANISAVFVVENAFRVCLYAILGVFTVHSLHMAALLLPAGGVGLLAGILSGKKLDERVVKTIVIMLLLVSGVALIAMNI